MKKILPLLLATYCFLPGSFAQNNEYARPAALGISFFLNDFVTPQRIRSGSLSKVLNDKNFAKINEMAPGMAVSYFKGITNHLDFAGTLGGSFPSVTLENRPNVSGDNFLLEADASANFKMTTEKYWVQPYLSAGVGAGMYKSYFSAFVPLGVGLKLNLFEEASVFITSQYRIPVTAETNAYHLIHSIGIAGNIGKKKEVPLKVVAIPQTQPVDSDGDGVMDDKDKCPTVPGSAKYDGCPVPDTDKDGINDDEDKCPDVPGIVRYQGCPIPDTDKDGINDEEDKCKDVPGLARYQGCPIPDSDNDGVNDEEDKCPQLAGSPDNHGCPVIAEEVRKKVEFAARNIYFNTGSDKLLAKSNKGLNEVAKILRDNAGLKLAIDGYTDDKGKAEKNQALSEKRAKAVKQYLLSKGVDEARLASAGHGPDNPVADNKTAAGRAKNRRVELKLDY